MKDLIKMKLKNEGLLETIVNENNQMELREFEDGTKRYILNFEFNGYDCEIIRHPSLGHLCGYVTLSQDEFISNDIWDYDFNVHGAITYTNGETLKIGFDCAHYMDKSPYMETYGMDLDGEYRDLHFVKNEIKNLVEQIIAKKGE